MNRLWAPWRHEFVGSKPRGCIFCRIPGLKDDRSNLLLKRGSHTFLLMNRYPYNSGHLMVATYRHIVEIGELRPDEAKELVEMLKLGCKVLKDELRAEGFNLGSNIGRVAGAGFEHLHLHIVPRWSGDTNFMPVVGETKVLPEHLESTYARLRRALKS
jgi:ATP adenylyltransferase